MNLAEKILHQQTERENEGGSKASKQRVVRLLVTNFVKSILPSHLTSSSFTTSPL